MPEEKKATGSKSSVVKKLKATAAAGAYQKQWFFDMKARVEREGCDFAILNADGNLPCHGHSVCCKPVVGCNLRSKTYDPQVCPADDRQWLSQ